MWVTPSSRTARSWSTHPHRVEQARLLGDRRTGTPISVVKVGRSASGAAMALSHTGHLVGSDQVYDAFFAQFGINRVDELDELAEVGVALARCPVPEADGVVVCSVSGGAAAHVCDLAAQAGLAIPKLSAQTQAALREIVPAEFRVDNPVDNGGPIRPRRGCRSAPGRCPRAAGR